MATGKHGPNGGLSGTFGSVVGYYRLGTWVVRGLPKARKKKRTATNAQKASRSTFTKMQHFLAPIVGYIRVGFNMEGRSKNMTAHNAAKSYNMLNAFTADGEIDISKVVISYGKLPGAENPVVVKDPLGLLFSWTNNSVAKGANGFDQVILLAYDVQNQIAHGLESGARRRSGKQLLEFDELSTRKSLHTWIAFISDDRERISMSTYLGEIGY